MADTHASFHLYLASASPRRCKLLEQIGVCYRQRIRAVDETPLPDESPHDYVSRLALLKARTVHEVLEVTDTHPVLGADTAVVVDEHIFGKPLDQQDALSMLAKLSGRCHQVYSAVALVGRQQQVRVSVSEICFKELSMSELLAYWQSGEPRDKAGAYAIQGRAAMFIERISGSYSGVMGLPLFETNELLLAEGIDMLNLDSAVERNTNIVKGSSL